MGEVCGLWNSRKFAPKLGITVLLSIAAISICDQMNVKNLFAICAGYTLPMARRLGFEIERSVGNDGEFIYPNSNFVARVLRMNCITLATSNNQYRNEILELRTDRNRDKKITMESGEIDLHYDLGLTNISYQLTEK